MVYGTAGSGCGFGSVTIWRQGVLCIVAVGVRVHSQALFEAYVRDEMYTVL